MRRYIKNPHQTDRDQKKFNYDTNSMEEFINILNEISINEDIPKSVIDLTNEHHRSYHDVISVKRVGKLR
jgi:hypothetical protein